MGFLHGLLIPYSLDAADTERSVRGIRALKVSLALLAATSLLQLVVIFFSGSVAGRHGALTAVPLWVAFISSRSMATRTTTGWRRRRPAGLFIIASVASAMVESIAACSSHSQ